MPAKILGVLVTIACLWLLVGALLAAVGLLTRAQPADVAVVLGNTVRRDGNPSPRLRARLDTAFQCYEKRQCGIIFVSGGIDAFGTNEAIAMRAYLVRLGIPADRIAVDSAGANTWATARNASTFMRNRGLSSVIVVTQYFHLPRTILAFRRFDVREVSGAYPRFWEGRDFYSILREVPAFIWYGIRPN